MSHVITRLCRDCVDTSCVEACPVDCIVALRPGSDLSLPNQLFIDPEECICCAACEPVCPWEAIADEDDVPAAFREDVALNALVATHREAFFVPEHRLRRRPDRENRVENRARWLPGNQG